MARYKHYDYRQTKMLPRAIEPVFAHIRPTRKLNRSVDVLLPFLKQCTHSGP